ncbi:MAG: DUF5074 domain-containing protein [Bacteroidales bacterium]
MKHLKLAVSIALAALATSCNTKENPIEPPVVNPPKVSISNPTEATELAQGDTLRLKASIEEGSEKTSFSWEVNGETASTDSTLAFVGSKLGAAQITLRVETKSKEYTEELSIEVHGKYKHGTFVLNEGSAFQHNGTLTFISEKGIVEDSIYYKNNDQVGLGSAVQDLFIGNGKIYIVTQNGASLDEPAEGFLIIANAETMKKEASYNTELNSLSWPSHVAALSANSVYIRDNSGLKLFNPTTKEISQIKAPARAAKNTMIVASKKLFVPAGKYVMVVEEGKDSISHAIEFENNVGGLAKADDGNLWVAISGSPSKICKVNTSTYEITKTNEVSEVNLSMGFYANSIITAKGNTLYFSRSRMQIYRHDFNKGSTEQLIAVPDYVEDAGMAYNNPAVHPQTGELYYNTIKGYGNDYLTNNISVFNFSKEPPLVANYKNHTAFPAGIFFTYNFE